MNPEAKRKKTEWGTYSRSGWLRLRSIRTNTIREMNGGLSASVMLGSLGLIWRGAESFEQLSVEQHDSCDLLMEN